MGRTLRAAATFVLAAAATVAAAALGVMVVQGRRRRPSGAEYIALGSSFAAGLGLGPRAPGSPYACLRGTYGYPQELARLTGLSLVDRTCSGATTAHVLHGGQYFQRPQIDALGPATGLVTLTTGGNDVSYIGDLVRLSTFKRLGTLGFGLARLGDAPAKAPEDRPFADFASNLEATLTEIRRRAPAAHIIVVTYPAVLPAEGTCAAIAIDATQAATMRRVADRLATLTRTVAQGAGATVVDMATLAAGHEACAPEPWVNGARPATGAAFHPTRAGAAATAQAIHAELAQRGFPLRRELTLLQTP